MMSKTKILCLILVATQIKARANGPLNNQTLFDKIAGSIGQSKQLYLFEKHIMSKIIAPTIKVFGDEMASEEYQNLGEEAQHALRIHQERHVPIKKLDPNSPLAKFVGGLAFPETIYVNEEKLNQATYGYRRHALFHEAVHKKYNDMSADTLVELGVMIASSIGALFLIKAAKPKLSKVKHGIGIFSIAVLASMIASNRFHYYFERRADIEGIYAAQCSVCAQESATRRRESFEVEKNPLRNGGYLWAKDMEKIAQDLKQQDKICSYHEKS